MEEDAFVFQSSKSPLNENVVETSPDSVHAYLYPKALQHRDEFLACVLSTAVCIKNGRNTILFNGFHNAFDAEDGIHRIAEPPGKDLSAVEINHRSEVDHSPWKSDVGDIRFFPISGENGHHLAENTGEGDIPVRLHHHRPV